jgi:N-acetylmuramoyl-L-alanine amidase
MKKLLLLGFLAAFLTGCYITSIPASRRKVRKIAQFLILHYTAIDEPTSLKVLSQQGVSSHYLVGDQMPVKVWQLVDESKMSYHAGLSDWKGYSRLNASSIGIESESGFPRCAGRPHLLPVPTGTDRPSLRW